MTLAEYLKTTGQTPGGFAKRLGRTRATITRLLHGQRNASRDLADQIYRATGGTVTAADLYGHDGSVPALATTPSDEAA